MNFLDNFRDLVNLKDKKEFYKMTYEDNLGRMLIIGILFGVLELLGMLLIDFDIVDKKLLLSIYVILILLIGYIFTVLWISQHKDTKYKSLIVFNYMFLISLIGWAVYASSFVVNGMPLINVYAVTVLMVSAIIYIPLYTNIGMMIAAYATLNLLIRNSNSKLIDNNFILFSTFAITLVSIVISNGHLLSRFKSYQYQVECNKLKDKLAEYSVKDLLTNLYNNQHIFERLGQEIERSTRYGENLCILLADLDHFSQVNENYGYDMGDKTLSATAKIIIDGCRASDIVGRYGGEEYIIILPDTDIRAARMIAERLRVSIESNVYEKISGLTISIGIAEMSGQDDISTMIDRADKNLYKAKNDGRNRVEG